MSSEIDYPTKLKKYLWENLKKKNESIEKFEQRIEGCYFSENVLDYPLVFQMTTNPDGNVFVDAIFKGNLLFLDTFKSKAKSKLTKILRKINEITKTHVKSHLCKNAMALYLLSIFYEEKFLKQDAQWINSELSVEIQKAIEMDLSSFHRSINDLLKIFSKNHYSHEYYLEKIINPIMEMAVQSGLSKEKLMVLAKFIEEHKNNELTELRDAKFTDAVAKREKDYSALSRDNLTILFNFMKKEIGIRPIQALRHIADLFDLFEIRQIQDIVDEYGAKKEKWSRAEARKQLAKRIGDVIKKPR